mmetsp:Transcript_48847/g.141480  ORF Transcript_48847/g.141480 Transcript_48847/m.141480 type:complete len:243 (-) Transcript_48847:187-915(-)
MQLSGASGNLTHRLLYEQLGSVYRPNRGQSSRPGQIFRLGVPSSSHMRWSWCSSALPGRSGFLLRSSPKLQPMDQMSTLAEYVLEPSSSSGERYQSVTTFLVQGWGGSPNSLARPKSASFRTPRLVRSRLLSLMSRCITDRACRCSTARSSCSTRHFTSAWPKGLSMRSRRAPTSCSQYSNTRKTPPCRPHATSKSVTMFGCRSRWRSPTSREELLVNPFFSAWDRTFLRATIWPFSVSRAR